MKPFASDTPENFSVLPEHVQAQQGFKRKSKTHRGRRAGPKAASIATATNHHQDAKDHATKAIEAKTPNVAFTHLMKAVKSMHKARSV